MRRAVLVLVVACLVLSMLTGVVAPVSRTRADTYGDYTYTVSGGKATITGYTGPGGVVVLPSMLGGYPVTTVGAGAFLNCSSWTSVTIPNSVTSIGKQAFYACTGLTTVVIPNSVTSIGDIAFFFCSSLTSVTIPNSVTTIGDYAFGNCSSLTILAVNPGNPSYSSSADGVLFNKTATLLIQCPGGKQGAYVIPNSVTGIGFEAFRVCRKLTSVTVPGGVSSIGGHVFELCSALTAAYFLGNAPTMGTDVFVSCATGFTVYYLSGTTGWTNPWYTYPTATFSAGTYTLTPSAGTGGTITPNTAQTVLQGGSMSFGITPAAGYRVADVTVDGVSVGRVFTYEFVNVTSSHTIKAAFEREQEQTVIVLQIGKSTFTVNGTSKTLDSPPVIKNGRTLVPIRTIIEALGGAVGWDGTARKATVTLGSAMIELWIGKSSATVNGTTTPIDAANTKVVPEIINGRTMLPVRFVSENLGCSVLWADATKTITITYDS